MEQETPSIKLSTPLTDQQISSLRAGAWVTLSGIVYAARDQAHRRLAALLEKGQPLPFDVQGAVIYYVGPTPPPPGRVIGSAGPTTAGRMDAFTPLLLKAGLKGTIGKGCRSRQVQEALVQYRAVHFSAMGGFGALLARHIVDSRPIAYEDLGPEAVRRLVFRDFPAIVAYDCYGSSIYEQRSKG
ncbi:MAG TPA: FumA C-terminus/TtdB family hydratase beta subunit [Anaerohalosphaeraceae bacterium]|jgi:fumarate hydratase subunit beta|nr:FumA C-terminus/TtdB family hydratase beta subunit [Anaerohalosphaeraceae bacterium]HPB92953.1 FumA C-terminus/TtdB family hydratase beta subunit [Anaerohalosphaeraceae bacterium]HRT23583.1 FumA C-terminus/TtdB family hydratase beta subunit [Anaerohalosphaeraceae bacterium]HRU15273.1 FumA C-terminus/TtdB family hydratase beta subunit [Anaerohalosphaeraceae bacterium]